MFQNICISNKFFFFEVSIHQRILKKMIMVSTNY